MATEALTERDRAVRLALDLLRAHGPLTTGALLARMPPYWHDRLTGNPGQWLTTQREWRALARRDPATKEWHAVTTAATGPDERPIEVRLDREVSRQCRCGWGTALVAELAALRKALAETQAAITRHIEDEARDDYSSLDGGDSGSRWEDVPEVTRERFIKAVRDDFWRAATASGRGE